MDTSTAIALVGSGLAIIGTLQAIWQASSASKQAQHAEEQVRVAQDQLDQMRTEARSHLHSELVSAFSALHTAFVNFIYICGNIDRQLRTGTDSAAFAESVKSLSDTHPGQQPSLFVLAKFPADSPIGPVLTEALDRAKSVWYVMNRINDAMFGDDDELRAQTVAELGPTLNTLAKAANRFAEVASTELIGQSR